MKKSKLLLAISGMWTIVSAVLLVGNSGCSKDEERIVLPTLDIPTESIVISKEGAVDTITFSTNGAWTVNGPAWVNFETTEGIAGENQMLIFSAEPNESFNNRKGEVSMVVSLNNQNLETKISVEQLATERFITFDKEEVREPADGTARATVTVSSNVNWIFDESLFPDWLTILVKNGTNEDEKILDFRFALNDETTSERSFDLKLNDIDSDFVQSITVTQLGAKNLFIVEGLFQYEMEFLHQATAEESLSKSFTVKSTEEWEFSQDLQYLPWIKTPTVEKTVSNGIILSKVTISVFENPTFEQRFGQFSIRVPNNQSLFKRITVTQMPTPVVITFSPNQWVGAPASGGQLNVTISMGELPWEVSFISNKDWVKVAPVAGIWGQYTITLQPNTTGSERSYLIPVRFTDEQGQMTYYEEFLVKQAAN